MIYVFLANGFEEIEALAPVDILRRAGFDVRTVAIGPDNKVVGAHGIPVIADINECELCTTKPEAIILPGGMPGASNLDESATVSVSIQNALDCGGLVCAICAAPFILGKLGLLEGKRATCFPGFENYLEGAIVTDEKVVRDGQFITAKGMGCANDFGLAIVEALSGKEKADEIAESVFHK
ncbi:MAG: DJ-1/PfpI family protein [Clostridia bacterium]|nr:DJ-1/PfpI family protein [Clostridia bacterium]